MTALRASEPRASAALRHSCFPPMRGPTSRSCGRRLPRLGREGRAYLDFVAGIAVVGLGHCAAAPVAAAHAQLDRLWHASNLYWSEPMLRLAGLSVGEAPRGAGVLLQLRCRGERGGAQDRPQGNRPLTDRRARGRLSRAYSRRPLRRPDSRRNGKASDRCSPASPSRSRTTSSHSRPRSRRPATLPSCCSSPCSGRAA